MAGEDGPGGHGRGGGRGLVGISLGAAFNEKIVMKYMCFFAL